MRVATSWSNQLGINAMLNQQTKLNETQLKLSSGKKYLTPSENPLAATSLLSLDQRIKENQQYQDNIGVARQRLSLENTGLSNATDILQKIRELTVQGLNASNSAENRKQIAGEVDQLNAQLLNIANTQNANGEYIFSGYATDKRAFTDSPYAYQGDANQRSITIGPNRLVTDGDPGESVFGTVSGGPLAAGSIDNVFQAVAQLSSDLKANAPATLSLDDLDRSLVRIGSTEAAIGARLKALDGQENLNAEYILDHQTTVSEIGDLDYADALSKFNSQNVSLQAAQQAFTRVQKLSLFNYL
jgi:flagellar hook-associated protein 3 FlgL